MFQDNGRDVPLENVPQSVRKSTEELCLSSPLITYQSASHSLVTHSVKLSLFQYPGLSLISRELKEHGREVLGPLGERGEGIAVTTNVFNLKVNNKYLYYGGAGGGGHGCC